MSRKRNILALLLAPLALTFGGCLSDDGPAPMCYSTADCDRGEVCDEGICFGDPPTHITFAAMLVPPQNSDPRLVSTEIPALRIAQDGTISNLVFAQSVTLFGVVTVSCPPELNLPCSTQPQPADATILVERPSKIPGAPRYKVTAVATADAGFRLDLPKSVCSEGVENCEDAYDVTIIPRTPRGKVAFGETAIALAPPKRTRLVADVNRTILWQLGRSDEVKSAHGCVTDGNGMGLTGLTATALGRLSPLAPPVRASSKGITDNNGCFTLLLTRGTDSYDIVLEPEAAEDPRPHIRWRDRLIPDPPSSQVAELGVLEVSDPGPSGTVAVQVRGHSSSGELLPVPGAQVVFNALVDSSPQDQADVTLSVRGESAGVTGDLLLSLAHDLTYTVDVLPPPGSEFAAAFASATQVDAASTLLLELGRRLPVQGRLKTFDGRALYDARLRATISPSWFLTADGDTQNLLAGFALPSATTTAKGDYQIWLDRDLHGQTAIYDLSIEPPTASGAPVWSIDAVKALGVDGIDLGEVQLPDNSWARGILTDAQETPIAGAQLQLFQLRDPSACDGRCQPAPYARGTFAADKKGRVNVLLPDPPPPGAHE